MHKSIKASWTALVAVGFLLAAFLSGCANGGRPQALAITSSAPPSGPTQAGYGANGSGFPLTASGGVAPYTWSWTAAAGSSLPPGLKVLSSTISGTPSTAGSFNVTVTVTDSATPAAHASSNYAIVVASSVGLAISSGPLPDGTAGTAYSPHLVSSCYAVESCLVSILGPLVALRPTHGVGPQPWGRGCHLVWLSPRQEVSVEPQQRLVPTLRL
jgi:hypothetical protein